MQAFSNKNCSSKTLTISEENQKVSLNNGTPVDIDLTTASIEQLVGKNINLSGSICSQEASLSSIDIYYDSTTNTTHLHNLSKNLVIHMDGSKSIKITERGEIIFENHLDVIGNVKMKNGLITENLDANNVNLLGDLIATNILATNNLKVANDLDVGRLRIHGDVKMEGPLMVPNIVAGKIKVDETETILVRSPIIRSLTNLNLEAGPEYTINVPNIRHSINVSNLPTIDPPMIKMNKIFIINKNILLQGDPSCDGMEIIVYNQCPANVIIRDSVHIICHLNTHFAIKLVYLAFNNQWVRI